MSNKDMLEYETKLYQELMEDDGLVIMAKGLGLDQLLLKTMHTFCNQESLLVVLNTNVEEQIFFINELTSDGVTHLPKVIVAETGSAERQKLYRQGGVFFVTSRILVVDMLTKKIPIDYITGLLVHRAHKIGESSQEAFILRLFRESNAAGFIKGFSDSPCAFTAGYCRVERVMKQLFVRKLYLRPRFHADVVECLEKHKPDVVELSVDPTPFMTGVQLSILDLMEACLRELKKSAPIVELEDVTLESSLTKTFDKLLKVQLDPHWNQLSGKTRQLVSDVKVLRVLLSYLTQYDCVTFYSFLQSLRANQTNHQSFWMFMDAANSLFVNAKARVFGCEKLDKKTNKKYTDGVMEMSPKWEALKEILNEIDKEKSTSEDCGNVLLCASDERTCSQLKQFLCEGGDAVLQQLFEKSLLNTMKSNSSTKSEKGEKVSGKKRKIDKHPPDTKTLSDDDTSKVFNIMPNSMIILHALSGSDDTYDLWRKLHENQPKYVILYDAQMECVRQLEVFKASKPGIQLRVYFLFYNGSVEEQRYLTTLHKEKNAFEMLIRQKADMVVPEERPGKTSAARSSIRNQRNEEVLSTRKSGGRTASSSMQLVVVDVREFRSDLPSLIHKRGMDIEPVTLEVGDYILSPDVCVERKNISDLIGSLNNGRLYTQCVAMTRFYKRPILLIEFDETKTSFSLQDKKSLGNEVSLQNVSSKLTLLTIHFPKLKIIWSQSPYLTAEIFEDLKSNSPQPDAQVAMAIGVDQDAPSNAYQYSMVPSDVVQKIPGVNSKNYRQLMNRFSSIKELVNQTENAINDVIENSSNAKRFCKFVEKVQDVSSDNKMTRM